MFHNRQEKRLATRLGFVLLMLVLVAGFAASPASAANDDHIFINMTVPFDVERYNPCGNGGQGEYVDLTGELHVVFFEIPTGNGTIYKSQVNAVNVSGVGELSGVNYRYAGMGQGMSTVRQEGSTYTSIDTILLVSQGAEENLVAHSTFHVTVTPDGEESTVVYIDIMECR